MAIATAVTDPDVELAEIQGNVLYGYGARLPLALYVVLRITDAAPARRLLADLLPGVTKASDRSKDLSSALNIAISYRGLSALGVPEPVLATFPDEFASGMAARAKRLDDIDDSAPERWEPGLRDIELLLVLHARGPEEFVRARRELLARVRRCPGVACQSLQPARMLGDRREHFGYQDGFGQPAIAEARSRNDLGQGVPGPRFRPERGLALGEFVHGYRDEDEQAAPLLAAPFTRNGTFMVLRKLAQDVVAFRELVRSVAEEHFHGDEALVEAKLAGRWRDGTPLIVRPTSDPRAGALLAPERNHFSYTQDPHGYVCPLGAHIRRANPRDALNGGFDRTRRHRIIRRGMPYGPALGPGAVDTLRPGARGLMFVCFNASIARQFEVVNGWLTDGGAFGLGRDGDLLTASRPHLMSLQGEPPVLIDGRRLVWTRGGEYLLLPSRSALRQLTEV